MRTQDMGVIERKVLGALLTMANGQGVVEATTLKIAEQIGYKRSGGAITFALRLLEQNNYIVRTGLRKYKVLI